MASSAGTDGTLPTESESLLRRQHDLTQELAIQVIQLISRNKSSGPSNPTNELMMKLMRRLLEHDQRSSEVAAAPASSTTEAINQFFRVSDSKPPAAATPAPSVPQQSPYHHPQQQQQQTASMPPQPEPNQLSRDNNQQMQQLNNQPQHPSQQNQANDLLAKLVQLLAGQNNGNTSLGSSSNSGSFQPQAQSEGYGLQQSQGGWKSASQQPNQVQQQVQQPIAPAQAMQFPQQQQQPEQSQSSDANSMLLLTLLGMNANPQQKQQLQQLLQQQKPQQAQQQAVLPAPPQLQQQQVQQPQTQQQQSQQQTINALRSLLQSPNGQNAVQGSAVTNSTVPSPMPSLPDAPQQQHAIREVNIPFRAYPMSNIEYPGPHDVVLGRGRGASSHIGNVNFRGFIKQFKPKYAAANRVDKPKVAGEVVMKWREKNPPGRFLVQVRTTNRNVWNDVGDRKARQKTSQSLRERECIRKPRRVRRVETAPAETMDEASSVESGGSAYDEDDSGSTSDTSETGKQEAGQGPNRVSGESSSGESDEKTSSTNQMRDI